MQYKSKIHKVLKHLFKSLLLLYDASYLVNASSALQRCVVRQAPSLPASSDEASFLEAVANLRPVDRGLMKIVRRSETHHE